MVAVTRAGAEILRVEGETRTFEAGEAADLEILRCGPRENSAALDEAEMLLIMKQGRVVKDVLSATG